VLREECIIPVWHDDAQGTACVTLAGLLNALKLANKKMSNAKMVLFGAGAANTTIARLIIADGGDPHNMVIFDSHGGLHKNREDIKADHRFYRKWELCEQTNPQCINTMEEAMRNADVLISVSTPGPDTIKQEWVKLMAPKSVVFACANPVPEIYPYAAKEAGAYIVATGRGDFPNQVNNSIGFPGILKGALIARASKITDSMAIAAAHSLAGFAEKRGISPENIVPTMDEADVFPVEAADVAVQAVKEGVARRQVSWEEAYRIAKKDIESSRSMTKALFDNGYIANPPAEMLEDALLWTIQQVEAKK